MNLNESDFYMLFDHLHACFIILLCLTIETISQASSYVELCEA